jgi:hypothetical protein
LFQLAVTAVSEEAFCIPRTYRIERLTYGLYQRLTRTAPITCTKRLPSNTLLLWD